MNKSEYLQEAAILSKVLMFRKTFLCIKKAQPVCIWFELFLPFQCLHISSVLLFMKMSLFIMDVWNFHYFLIDLFPLKSFLLVFRFFNQRTKLVSSSTWCKTSQLCSHYYADFYLSPTKCWLPSLTAYIFHHKLPH